MDHNFNFPIWYFLGLSHLTLVLLVCLVISGFLIICLILREDLMSVGSWSSEDLRRWPHSISAEIESTWSERELGLDFVVMVTSGIPGFRSLCLVPGLGS